MDSDHEHEDHDDEDPAVNTQKTALTGFLFGNIDCDGQLEDDLLDEDSKRHLGGLTALGMGSMVNEIAEDGDGNDSDGEGEAEGKLKCAAQQFRCNKILFHMADKKLDSAVDYSDINEMAVDEEEARYKAAMAEMEAPTVGGGSINCIQILRVDTFSFSI
jgi:transcription initiation factor TFIID subunit 1